MTGERYLVRHFIYLFDHWVYSYGRDHDRASCPVTRRPPPDRACVGFLGD